VLHAVALVVDSNWAMRELMRRTLEGVAFMVLESGTAEQVEVALRTPLFVTAPRALLVVSASLIDDGRAVLSSLGQRRAALGFAPPHIALTCEFGAASEAPQGELSGCVSAGILEKPFDFALLQDIAYRCRTAPS